MEEGEQQRLLVVDEKETCLAQFVPENTFEHIWNQETPTVCKKTMPEVANDDTIDYEAVKSDSLSSVQGKVKPAENPLFRRKVVEENTNRNLFCAEELLTTPKDIAAKFDDIVRDGPKLCRSHLRTIFEVIYNFVSTLFNLVLLVFGNRWAWNIMVVITKLSFTVFIYLVIAFSTGIIAIICNIHDAYVKIKLEKNDESVNKSSTSRDQLETCSFQSVNKEYNDAVNYGERCLL